MSDSMDLYINLNYRQYKRLEDQVRNWEERETVHTSVEGFYHKSFSFVIDGVRFEFHGPNVKAGNVPVAAQSTIDAECPECNHDKHDGEECMPKSQMTGRAIPGDPVCDCDKRPESAQPIPTTSTFSPRTYGWPIGREREELVDLIRGLAARQDALPSYEACWCGGDPHPGQPCGKGSCDCKEYQLRDVEGHALKAAVEKVLGASL